MRSLPFQSFRLYYHWRQRGMSTYILSPDGADKREAAFARRLDRLSRQVQRLERDLGVTAETRLVRALLADDHAALAERCSGVSTVQRA